MLFNPTEVQQVSNAMMNMLHEAEIEMSYLKFLPMM